MSFFYDDPDTYETVITASETTASMMRVPRAPEEVARIKAERLAREEDEILRKADAIRARPHTPEPENAEDRAVQAKSLSDKVGIPEDDEA